MRTTCILCGVLALAAGPGFGATFHKGWKNALKPHGRPGPKVTLAFGGQAIYTLLLPAKPTSQERRRRPTSPSG